MEVRNFLLNIIAGMSETQLKNVKRHYPNIKDLIDKMTPIRMKLHLVLRLFRVIKDMYDDTKYVISTNSIETKKILDLVITRIQALLVCSKTIEVIEPDNLYLSEDLVSMIKGDVFVSMVFNKILYNSNQTKMTTLKGIIFQDLEKVSKKRKRIDSITKANKKNKFVLDDSFLELFSDFSLNEKSSKLELDDDEDKNDGLWTPECETST